MSSSRPVVQRPPVDLSRLAWLSWTHAEAGRGLKLAFRGLPRHPEAGFENKNSMARTQSEAAGDPNLYNTNCGSPEGLERK